MVKAVHDFVMTRALRVKVDRALTSSDCPRCDVTDTLLHRPSACGVVGNSVWYLLC